MKATIGIVSVLVLAASTTAALAIDPSAGCEASKLKTAGKHAFCRMLAEAKAVKSGQPPDYSKCDSKFASKWQAAEAKGECPTSGDQSAVRADVDADCDALVLKIGGGGLVDNGDGTVTDIGTGLTWEKKDNLGGVHDKDNLYSWSATGSAPDGTAFTTFLGVLNNSVSDDGTAASGCFAGHCDWRLPTIVELQTLLIEPFPCGTSPCADPALGPTEPGSYWSRSTNAAAAVGGWYLFFVDGTRLLGPKTNTLFARAVRGGSN